jgi:N-methylhydantoinase B
MTLPPTDRVALADASLADPVTAEVVRRGLVSAAEQMKRALIRTSFSPVICEILDFAAALYDPQARLLAQAPSNPLFMGTMGFCVEGACAAVAAEGIGAGDIILINVPYITGSHQQDAAVVMPAFVDDELVGFAAIKAHWQDMGAKEPYCTNTVDVFQEGVVFPGVKLYRGGALDRTVEAIALANTRMPEMVAGDIDAEVVAVRTGVRALERLITRHGCDRFWNSVARVYAHGEAVTRRLTAAIPDGRYAARGRLDDDGIGNEPIEFEVVVTVEGTDVTVDYTGAPDATTGPLNCPFPSTVSASRVAIAMLAGANEPPNEGSFAPIRVVARPGSMFFPRSPDPCYLYGWTAMQALDALHHALADAMPQIVPAGNGGDICGVIWWGDRNDAEPWSDSTGHPIGYGASAVADGANSLMHLGEAASRFCSAEVWEVRYPVLWERCELAPDSCGAGRMRGGLGVDAVVRTWDDASVTCVVERTKTPPWGLHGGLAARANNAERTVDGTVTPCAKATALALPRGARLHVQSGGGGGYGHPSERDPRRVHDDIADGYISEVHARRYYPHAFDAQQGQV